MHLATGTSAPDKPLECSTPPAAPKVTSQNPPSSAVDPSSELLHRLQKLHVIEQLSGGVAHDLNNSFQNIVASMELVRKLVASGRGNEIERFIGRAMSSANVAVALTQRWFGFSRSPASPPRSVAMNEVVSGIVALLLRVLAHPTKVEADLSPEPWSTFGDVNRIETALLTLALHAFAALPPEGGELVFRTHNVDRAAGEAGPAGLQPGQYVCVSVTCLGGAMGDAELRRAFDALPGAKPDGPGAGSGLAVVRDIARQSGGEATMIRSEDGAGATVTMFLPRHLAGDDTKKAG